MTAVAEPLDPFRFSKFKPLARGKQRDTFTLSGPDGTTGHILEGAVRSSKTIVSIIRWLVFVTEGPPGGLAMIGKTERSLKRNVLDVIVQLLGPKRAKIVQGSGIMRICGREVYLAGANDEAAVAKIQGMTLVGFYGDEAPTWPQSVFDMARTRCSDPGAQWFVTGNPASSTHHLKTDWIDRAAVHLQRDGSVKRRSLRDPGTQDVTVYSYTIYDNPHLTPEFIQLLERSYVGVFRKRYILGEWCLAEGAILDAWDDARHVLPWAAIPPLERWIGGGVDYGTVNPFHAVTLALGPLPRHIRDDRPGRRALYVTAEHRYAAGSDRRRKTDLEHAVGLQAWLRHVRTPGAPEVRGFQPDPLAVDPSAASFRVQCHGLGMETTAADNNVLAGVRDLASLVAHDRLFICEDAAELIKEIPGYVWDDKAAKLGLPDRPVKERDHGIDATRYIARTARDDWWDEVFPEQLPTRMLDQLGEMALAA